jgi:DNA processing protein
MSSFVVKISDPEYPSMLKHVHQAPEKLYYRGDLEVLEGKLIAFVGTRACTPYGRVVTEKLIEELSLCGVVIVSGLARGIDTCAHEAALKFGLKTVAVLGTGIENIYPSENSGLADRIVSSGGCILSEYGMRAPARKFSFPARNRIISGLSLATVVIEAPESSGALITAKRANEEDREVFAVPADIDRDGSVGCNRLIQGLFAKPVLTGMDIIRELKMQPGLFRESAGFGGDGLKEDLGLGKEVNSVFEAISNIRPVSVDQVVQKTGLSVVSVNKSLSLLEINDFVSGTNNGFYLRSF